MKTAPFWLAWSPLWVWLAVACTNFVWDPLGNRYAQNVSGDLPPLSDITVGSNFSFAVFGDTHIGSPGGKVMQNIVSNASTYGDAFVVVAGDVSENGDIGQFRQFKTVMQQFNMPYRVAIGNHDIFFEG